MPLANALVAPGVPLDQEERFPLTLTFCPACALVQLAETIDPEKLFRHYVYLSSNSPAFVQHAKSLVQRMIGEQGLDRTSRAIEIASNDGYLLQHYRDAGVPVLGIEPAANIAALARERGIETIGDFFTAGLARTLSEQGKHADVLHAHNVLAHVPDLKGFVAGISTILAPGGVAVLEFPYLIDLVDNLEFDTIYHEHLCYFSLAPLVQLFERAQLQIFDVERVAVHGGSLRLFASRIGRRAPRASLARMIEVERSWGVGDAATYRRFAGSVNALRAAIPDFLAGLRSRGKSIAAYGASAKGATLLNFWGIGRETIDFVVDRSTEKQGLTMPGIRLPIHAPERLLLQQPDYVLLLAWNFAEEIAAQQTEYLRRGGQFIVPVPGPRVLPR